MKRPSNAFPVVLFDLPSVDFIAESGGLVAFKMSSSQKKIPTLSQHHFSFYSIAHCTTAAAYTTTLILPYVIPTTLDWKSVVR